MLQDENYIAIERWDDTLGGWVDTGVEARNSSDAHVKIAKLAVKAVNEGYDVDPTFCFRVHKRVVIGPRSR